MVDYLVAMWNASTTPVERMGGGTSGLHYLGVLGLKVLHKSAVLLLNIITSIIGFSCLILLIGTFIGLLLPYIVIAAFYTDMVIGSIFN